MNIHFDFLAPIYDRVIAAPDPAHLANLLNLPADGWMLDAGGGTGRVSSLLRPMVGNLVINDLSLPMLQQAREKSVPYELVNGHVENLPFPVEHFDRILVVDALHHFADQPAAVAALARALKPGGTLVIEEPDINRFAVKLVALAEKLALMGSHFHSPPEIKSMVEANGLSARIESNGDFAAWIVAQK